MSLFLLQGWYLYLVMVRWFGLRIDTLSVAFLAAVAFISIPLAAGQSNMHACGSFDSCHTVTPFARN